MKKSLIALAVLAAAGAASAQSSVTLFGIVDVSVGHLTADGTTGKQKLTRVASGTESTSRLGLRGTEDLGGGLSASFWLEAELRADSGEGAASSSNNRAIPGFVTTSGANAAVRGGTQGLVFNRRSTVSLAGGFGELRLGRDYVPAFWNHTVFDPFGTVGVGSASNISLALGTALSVPTTVRASNTVGYFLPGNLGGFYGQAMVGTGENTRVSGTTGGNDGNVWGGRLGYAAGPLNVAVATTKTKNVASFAAGAIPAATATALAIPAGITSSDYTNTNVGASYNFGFLTVSAVINREKLDTNLGDLEHKTWMVGGTVPVGAGLIKASYGRGKTDDDEARGNQIAIGYVHNLSKRTAVYTTLSRIANKGTAVNYSQGLAPTGLNADSRGFDIGLRHSF
ncbi:MAG TPA: porin [Ramlibacter sp.]|jgi:predicted porin|uniref:porin n=1 Tax=Ramlibacter sp. TaxID=1917967 RepID=UPI002D421CAF|nr:porin [Ramlibacter sp.]HZY19716.1 porin [Ramlibacter sp.]